MRTWMIAASCFLSLASSAVAANPLQMLHPNDTEGLKAARIKVSCLRASGSEYAFTISAAVPEGYDSLDASLVVRTEKGRRIESSWSSSEGKCVAAFIVDEQALQDAWFGVQLFIGDKFAPFAASGGYGLKLSEFAEAGAAAAIPPGAAASEDFEISTPIKRGGPQLSITVKRKEAHSNHWYDVHVVVEGQSDQHFEVRNGQPITRQEVRLASVNADGYLDIMIVGGKDDLGREWYKTWIYNEEKREYRWIND